MLQPGGLGAMLFAAALALVAPPAAAFDLQGHRGARGLVPENTLPGFARALSIGVTTLEMDLGVSRDGALVVAHDSRLNQDLARGSDGRWIAAPGPALQDLTLEEIRRYDVGRIRPGSRYAGQYPEQAPTDGARMPTFAEVVALTRAAGNEEVHFNVETKLSPLEPDLTVPPEAFAATVVAAVRRAGVADRTTVQSFDWRTLRAVQAMAPEIPTVCLTTEQRRLDNVRRGLPVRSPWTAGLDPRDFAGVPALVEAAGCAVWSPYVGDLTPDALAQAHELGIEVIVWTVNEPDDMRRLIEAEVDGIITDYPDRLRAVMAEAGLPLPAPTPVEP